MEGTKFTVAVVPDKALSYRNCIYLNPGDLMKLCSAVVVHTSPSQGPTHFVSVQGRAFLAHPHEKVEPGTIGTSSIQRRWLGVEEAAVVYAKPEATPPNIRSLSMEFDLTPLPSGKKTACKLSEIDLATEVRGFGRVPLTKGQTICMKYITGETVVFLNAKVTDVELALAPPAEDSKTEEKKSASIECGLINTDMSCDFVSGTTFIALKKAKKKLDLSKIGIGALSEEFDLIFRRAFSTRSCDPRLVKELGIKHQKGLLLYGPPGTGKTLIAREIGKLLSDRPAVVINGPEILSKWVGAAEENIRKLFDAAREDWEKNKDNADLHIIIFDEIDSIARHRGSTTGTGVADTIVNQLLTMLDGVVNIPNVLVIGMTNRKDMIDPAVIRPGRLGVHVEIGLPTQTGREEILKIHTAVMKGSGHLHDNVSIKSLAEETKNFTGAELEELCGAAKTHALNEALEFRDTNKPAVENKEVMVTEAHFQLALKEITPSMGRAEKSIKDLIRGGIIQFSPQITHIIDTNKQLVARLQASSSPLLAVLFHGPSGAGMTAMAAKVAMDANCPFTKVISADTSLEFSEVGKCSWIRQTFEDAYRSALSIILIDGLEQLLEYVPLGPRYNAAVLQTLSTMLKKQPPPGRKLMVLATTSDLQLLKAMKLLTRFSMQFEIPQVTASSHLAQVFTHLKLRTEQKELEEMAQGMLPIAIKHLLLMLNMAKTESDGSTAVLTAASLLETYQSSGLQLAS